MISANRLLYIIFCIVLFLFFISSCTTSRSPVGRTAHLKEQIVIKNSASKKEVWQTGDMMIQYSVNDMGASFKISGDVRILDRISYTYPSASSLDIYVNLLNYQRTVTSRYNLGIIVSAYNWVEDPIPFETIVPKGEDTQSFAFSYRGTFTDGGVGSRKERNELYISHDPF